MDDLKIVKNIWFLDNLSKSLNFVCMRESLKKNTYKNLCSRIKQELYKIGGCNPGLAID